MRVGESLLYQLCQVHQNIVVNLPNLRRCSCIIVEFGIVLQDYMKFKPEWVEADLEVNHTDDAEDVTLTADVNTDVTQNSTETQPTTNANVATITTSEAD